MRYQLVLKKEHTLEELTHIMKTYRGKLGEFTVENIEFSGKLIWNVYRLYMHR